MPSRPGHPCSYPGCAALVRAGNRFCADHVGRGPATRTTIVGGPPGAGKSTYVRERKNPGDLVVDLDDLFVAISGLPMYEKPTALLPFALAARDAIIAELPRQAEVERAWIITSEPNRYQLDALRDRLGAELIVLATDAAECMRRIAGDERRGPGGATQAKMWQPIVERWWREYG